MIATGITDPTPGPNSFAGGSSTGAASQSLASAPECHTMTDIKPGTPAATTATSTSAISSTELRARYAEVASRVEAATKKSGRPAGSVILVAVTKYAAPEQVRTLIEAGHRDFGENRVQHLIQQAAMVDEFLSRQKIHAGTRRISTSDSLFASGAAPSLAPAAGKGADAVRWHMIGHLQRNKARKVVEFVRLIHSVDSLRIAEELQTIAMRRDEMVEVLLQVNCSGEQSKFGCPIAATVALADQINTMANIRLRGLMTMAEFAETPEDARPAFSRLRDLHEDCRRSGAVDPKAFNILSMGMTNDYEVAISEGANIVRVGTAIFGTPATPEPDLVEPKEPEEPEDANEG